MIDPFDTKTIPIPGLGELEEHPQNPNSEEDLTISYTVPYPVAQVIYRNGWNRGVFLEQCLEMLLHLEKLCYNTRPVDPHSIYLSE